MMVRVGPVGRRHECVQRCEKGQNHPVLTLLASACLNALATLDHHGCGAIRLQAVEVETGAAALEAGRLLGLKGG